MGKRYRGVVEAIYAPTATPSEWLGAIAVATHACFASPCGAMAYSFVLGEGTLAEVQMATAGPLPGAFLEGVWAQLRSWPRAMLEAFYAPSPVALLASELARREGFVEAFAPMLAASRAMGIEDVLAIRAIERGRGCIVAVPFDRPTRVAPRTRASCARIAEHLAVVWKLRDPHRERAEEDLFVVPDEVAPASEAERRALWDGLMQGSWEVIASRDQGCQRQLFLRRRRGTRFNNLALGARESAVVMRAAEGHSLKLIAMELSLAQSTVCEHLQRGLAKLGLAHRVELVRLASQLGVRGAHTPRTPPL